MIQTNDVCVSVFVIPVLRTSSHGCCTTDRFMNFGCCSMFVLCYKLWFIINVCVLNRLCELHYLAMCYKLFLHNVVINYSFTMLLTVFLPF